MATGNLTIVNDLFDQSFILTKQDNTVLNLNTTGTYSDKNIQLTLGVRSATVTLAASSSASILNLTYTYNSTSGNFNVSGSASISGSATATVSQAGWIENNFSGSVNGTASLSGVTVPKINIGATTGGTATVKPVINRTSTTVEGNAVNVGSTAATTTAPNSGFFVSVQSAVKTSTLYAMPNVISNGYGTTSYYTSTTASVTIGATASAVTYIPITAGVATANTANADITLFTDDGSNAGVNIFATLGAKATTEPSSGYYLAFKATGSGSSKVTTAGWFQTGALDAASTTSETKYYPVATAVYSVSGGSLSAASGYTGLSSDGYYDGSNYDTGDKIDITSQTSAAEGYYKVTASGYGQVNRTAITRQTTTAGYLPLDSNAITVSSTTNAKSNTATQAYYIKKSILDTTTYSSTNSNYNITIPAGYSPIDRVITVNKMATVSVTTNYANSGLSTYFDAGTSSNKDVTITPRYTVNAGYVGAQTNQNNGGIGYWKIKPATATYTTSSRSDTYNTLAGYCSNAQLATYTTQDFGRYKISGSTYKLTAEQVEELSPTSTGSQVIPVYHRSSSQVTRGNATISAGWIDDPEIISAAIFSNVPTSGATYVDLTESGAMPILDSGGKLYINAGYVDNIMVDLGQFIPDEANISSSDELISGSSGVNNEGDLIVGTLTLYDSSNLRADGQTVYVPSNGYFATTASCMVASGTYVAEVNLSSVTVTPSVSINNASIYGFTTTAPSGTNGTNFLTVTPESDSPTYSATGIATITKAGYIVAGSKYDEESKVVQVAEGQNYYIPIVVPSFSGGDLSQTATNTITTNMETSNSATYYIDAFAATTVTRAITQYSNDAGAITTHTNATVLTEGVIDASSTATRVYVPTATGTVAMTAGNGYCEFGNGSNITLSTTNTSGVAIEATGYGEVSAQAQITAAGYTPINNNFANGATTSNSATITQYITKIRLEAPNSGTNTFDLEIPNGSASEYITFRFVVDTSGNTTIEGVDESITPDQGGGDPDQGGGE